jgi:hypothetical protein
VGAHARPAQTPRNARAPAVHGVYVCALRARVRSTDTDCESAQVCVTVVPAGTGKHQCRSTVSPRRAAETTARGDSTLGRPTVDPSTCNLYRCRCGASPDILLHRYFENGENIRDTKQRSSRKSDFSRNSTHATA